MTRLSYLYLIAILATLGACVPPEQPLVITAPQQEVTNTKSVQQTDAAPAIASDAPLDDNAPARQTLAPSDNETAQIQSPSAAASNAVTDAIIDEETTAPDITPKAIPETTQAESAPAQLPKPEPKPEPEPEPEPEPFNPIILIGSSQASIRATFGTEDLSFSNGSMTIAHYRQDSCMMLVFFNEADIISHIDVRDLEIGKPLDEAACYRELGAKKEAKN